MGASLARLFADESGVTALEYGLMSFLISLVLVAAAGNAGQHVKSLLHIVAAFDSGTTVRTTR